MRLSLSRLSGKAPVTASSQSSALQPSNTRSPWESHSRPHPKLLAGCEIGEASGRQQPSPPRECRVCPSWLGASSEAGNKLHPISLRPAGPLSQEPVGVFPFLRAFPTETNGIIAVQSPQADLGMTSLNSGAAWFPRAGIILSTYRWVFHFWAPRPSPEQYMSSALGRHLA